MSPRKPSGMQMPDVNYTAPPDPATARRAALTVCRLDPEHARELLEALGLWEVLHP